MAPEPPFFELERVWVTKSDSRNGSRDVLRDVTLSVPAGARWVVVGPSGSGKSTLLRLLNRFEEPSRGEVRIEGAGAASLDPSLLRRRVALVSQVPVWLPGTARDNLTAAVGLGLLSPDAANDRLPGILRQAGLDESLLDRGEDQLSVGQRHRVVLGRALINRPRAILLDEPTAALDPPAARDLLDRIRELEQGELTVILVTHRMRDARRFGTRAIVLEDGAVADQGPPVEVLARLETRWGEESRASSPS